MTLDASFSNFSGKTDYMNDEWTLEFSIKKSVNAACSRLFIALYIKHPTCKTFKSNTFKMLLLLNRGHVCLSSIYFMLLDEWPLLAYNESV